MKPYQIREKSLFNNSSSLEELAVFKNFPIFIGATNEDFESDLFFDMVWDICKQTGMIQLRNLLPPNLIYSGYHSEGVGPIWEKHHFEFSEFVARYTKNKILEIGGSNGKLASILQNHNKSFDITIIEPNPSNTLNNNFKLIKSFFGEEFIGSNKTNFTSIVHSHTFEHVYDPQEFIGSISKLLDSGDSHIFSVPNLQKYLENKYTNTLNFEHTFFLTEYFCDYLLAKNKFRILDKYYYNEHSIFYATVKDNLIKETPMVNRYHLYNSLFSNFINFYALEIDKINKILKHIDPKYSVYVYGAHVFTQFLISNGLYVDNVVSVLDNSLDKKNKRLYGSELKINTPDVIRTNDYPVVILKVGQYQEEIKRQLLNLNSNVKIIE
jgi:hypothetical protein